MYVCANCRPTVTVTATPIDCGRGKWLTCKLCNKPRRMGWVIQEGDEPREEQ